jgi:hypothetical protein
MVKQAHICDIVQMILNLSTPWKSIVSTNYGKNSLAYVHHKYQPQFVDLLTLVPAV